MTKLFVRILSNKLQEIPKRNNQNPTELGIKFKTKMKHLFKIIFKGLFTLSLIFFINNVYSQTTLSGFAYLLSSDDYIAIKYTREYSNSGDNFVTKYVINHPTKGFPWIKVTATHNKVAKTVNVSVDDTNEGFFSNINEEKSDYETASLEPFGFRGAVGSLGGKRVPNQLMIKFVSDKFENVKVVHVLGSRKTDINNAIYFVLDEKN